MGEQWLQQLHYSFFFSSFFLEKNMQSFVLKTLMQKCGRYVCIQLLQTLNILFENIRNETSICEPSLVPRLIPTRDNRAWGDKPGHCKP